MSTVLAPPMSDTPSDNFVTASKVAAESFPAGNDATPALTRLADKTTEDLVQLFKLLADETRVRILYFLMQQDEINVRTLCELLGQSQPAVSHHLALLRNAGILLCRRDGKHNFYRLVPKHFHSYLETLFASNGDKPKKIRIANAVLTFSKDGAG